MINLNLLLDDQRAIHQCARSVSRLKHHKEFTDFIALLRTAQDYLDTQNRSAESPQLQWSQGAAQLLSDILDMIDHSESIARNTAER